MAGLSARLCMGWAVSPPPYWAWIDPLTLYLGFKPIYHRTGLQSQRAVSLSSLGLGFQLSGLESLFWQQAGRKARPKQPSGSLPLLHAEKETMNSRFWRVMNGVPVNTFG